MDQCPEEYTKFKDLFIKEKTSLALLKHQSWDYKISLIEKKKSTFRPIYKLLKNELKVLREYLDKYIKKGFI